jgi:hypothetical protein
MRIIRPGDGKNRTKKKIQAMNEKPGDDYDRRTDSA